MLNAFQMREKYEQALIEKEAKEQREYKERVENAILFCEGEIAERLKRTLEYNDLSRTVVIVRDLTTDEWDRDYLVIDYEEDLLADLTTIVNHLRVHGYEVQVQLRSRSAKLVIKY